MSLSTTLRGLVRDGRFDDAVTFYVTKMAADAAAPETALQKDLVFNVEQAQAWTRHSGEPYQSGRWWIIGLLAASVLIAIGSGRALIGSIARPVRGMTAAMRRLAEKDMAAEIPGMGRRDEIGAMADAVQVFKENMIKADQLAAEQEAERATKQQRSARLEALVQRVRGEGRARSRPPSPPPPARWRAPPRR